MKGGGRLVGNMVSKRRRVALFDFKIRCSNIFQSKSNMAASDEQNTLLFKMSYLLLVRDNVTSESKIAADFHSETVFCASRFAHCHRFLTLRGTIKRENCACVTKIHYCLLTFVHKSDSMFFLWRVNNIFFTL